MVSSLNFRPLSVALFLAISASQVFAGSGSEAPENGELEEALLGFEAPPNASARDIELEESLSGFEDPPVSVKKRMDIKAVNPLQISGQLSFKTAYGYQENAPQIDQADYHGLTKLQLTGLVKIDYKVSSDWKTRLEVKGGVDSLYNLKGRYNYSNDALNTYETELEIGEAYLSGALTDDLDLKIGRQIVVWGKSDSIRLTDVINPLDNRELGLVDIENLRLPVLMTRLDYYQGNWQYSLLAQHEHRTPKEAAVNSEYFPTSVLPSPPGFTFPDIPNAGLQLDETTFSVAASGRFSGWDLSLYGGTFQDSRWHFTAGNTAREYSLFTMAGLAANVIVDAWLFKAELAVLDGLEYSTVTDKQTRIDGLLGLEYKGLTDTTVSIELADRYLPNHVVQMESLPDAVDAHNLQTAIRVLYNFNHDRATIGYLGQYFGQQFEKGGFHRAWLDYELTQSVKITGGVIDYFGGQNALFEVMKNNDKLFVEAKYYF